MSGVDCLDGELGVEDGMLRFECAGCVDVGGDMLETIDGVHAII